MAKKHRPSVSAEAYGAWNKKRKFVAPVYAKSPQQNQRILAAISNSFLFSTLDEHDTTTVLGAFQEHQVKAGDVVIKQGDDGDKLYLIETGIYDVYKKDVKLPYVMRGGRLLLVVAKSTVLRAFNVHDGRPVSC